MKKININECWKDIPQYEGEYQASNFGRIRTLNYKRTGKTKMLKPGITSGYYRVVLCKNGKEKNLFVQRLVYAAFHGPIPGGLTVDHINGIKTDNRLENLQLLTRGDNARKARLGKKLSKETRAKMSVSQKIRWECKRSGIIKYIM